MKLQSFRWPCDIAIPTCLVASPVACASDRVTFGAATTTILKTILCAAIKAKSIPAALLLAVLLSVSGHAASVVEFRADNYVGDEASESGGYVSLSCTPLPANPVTVLLKATGGTADFADFRFINNLAVSPADWQAGWRVEIPAGTAGAGVPFVIRDDFSAEPDETLHFTLSILSGDAVVGALLNAVLTIRNGHPRIYADGRLAAEEGAPVRCQLWRRGDTNLVLSLNYATEDDTARAGEDYVAAAGTVTFAAGQLEAEIAVATLDNGDVGGGDGAFRLKFSTVAPGVELADTEALAVIRDNEQPVVWDRSFAPRPVSDSAAFALAPGGKLFVTEYPGPPLYSTNGTRVVRWNADGMPDPGFVPALLTYAPDDPFGPDVPKLVVDAEGRCVLAGRFDAINGQPRPGLARLRPDGTLDESFRPPPDLVSPYDPIHLAVQPDGRLLGLRRLSEGGHRFFRLNADGSLDGTFHPAETTTNGVRFGEAKVWATANNQALVEVSEYRGPFSEMPYRTRPLARLASDGSLDPAFHRAELMAPNGYGGRAIGALVEQPDGKLLVAGAFVSVDGRPRPGLVRLNADGAVDPGFAPPLDVDLNISSFAVDPEGRVLLAGYFRRFNGRDAGWDAYGREQSFSLVRLEADGTPDDSFAPVGNDAFQQVVPDLLRPEEQGLFVGGGIIKVFPQPDGKLLAWGSLKLWPRPDERPLPRFLARMQGEPSATSVALAPVRLSVEPGADQATVTVRRLGDTTGPATVNYATRDGSAVAGREYVAASGSLSFAPLEVTKSVSVPLLDPGVRRQDREFSVTLADATGVEGISVPAARLVLVAPFGFQRIRGPPFDPRLTIFGSVGSTYLLQTITSIERAWSMTAWGIGAAEGTTEVTLTNEVQTITDDPSWPDGAPTRFYWLRHLAP